MEVTMSNSYDFCAKVTLSDYRLLNKREVAEMLGISLSTLYRRVKSGEILKPHYSPSGYIRGWSKPKLIQWIKENH